MSGAVSPTGFLNLSKPDDFEESLDVLASMMVFAGQATAENQQQITLLAQKLEPLKKLPLIAHIINLVAQKTFGDPLRQAISEATKKFNPPPTPSATHGTPIRGFTSPLPKKSPKEGT